jgi:hypothetical protein
MPKIHADIFGLLVTKAAAISQRRAVVARLLLGGRVAQRTADGAARGDGE